MNLSKPFFLTDVPKGLPKVKNNPFFNKVSHLYFNINSVKLEHSSITGWAISFHSRCKHCDIVVYILLYYYYYYYYYYY